MNGMVWSPWTVALLVGCALLIAYEVYAAVTRATPTISGIVWYLSRSPAVPFFFGLLMGHFFL